ncbi:MAG: NfeD family protein [Candidatus Bathyarchaeota archaeon]|nr:NfeD family protein [Candidatus Bathyarchaeota archaeon]
MKAFFTVKADELKIAQLLSKFADKYRMSYKLNRRGTAFLLEVDLSSDDLGEFIRRMNHLKDAEFKMEEIRGGGFLDPLNVSLTRTNADVMIGKETFAKNDITPLDGGTVRVGGELWLARPADNEVIAQGSKVRVVRIEGVTLIVEGVTE